MKIPTLGGGLAATFLIAVSLPAAAQRLPTNYTMISYVKVAPENVAAYLALTKEESKKVAQARIDSGGIKSWSLIKLTSPYAAGSDHNYATVVTSATFPDLDPASEAVDAVYKKAGVNRIEHGKKLRALSTLARQSITRTVLRVGTPAEAGDYVRVDYHLSPADRPGELMQHEEAIYAPMFKAVIESGKGPKSWSVAMPVMPTQTEAEYTLYTTQVFKSSADLARGGGTTQEVFAKVHPNRSYVNNVQTIRSLDKIVKVRIYHVLDTIGSPVTGTR